jgi:hypothetical protein
VTSFGESRYLTLIIIQLEAAWATKTSGCAIRQRLRANPAFKVEAMWKTPDKDPGRKASGDLKSTSYGSDIYQLD